MMKNAPEMPNLAKRTGIRFVAGPLVNREHLVVIIVEADKAENVDQFIAQSGMSQWNNVRVIPSVTIEEGMKELSTMKTIF